MFTGEGMPLELDVDETLAFLDQETNYSECLEFWTIAAEVNATVSASGTDNAEDDSVADVSGGDASPRQDDVTGTSADSDAAEVASDESDTNADTQADDSSSPGLLSSQRVLQLCGEQPVLDKGDLRVAIVVSAAAPPEASAGPGAGNGTKSAPGAHAQRFFDSFVNK